MSRYRREMICLVAPHRPHYRDVVDHTSDLRKPVRNRDTRLSVACEGAMTRNDRTLHLGQVVSKSNRVDQRARPFVSLGIEGVDMADPAAHEQENDGLDARGEMREQPGFLSPALFSPKRSEGGPDKTRARLKQKLSTGNSPARIDSLFVHRRRRKHNRSSPHIQKLIQVEQQPGEPFDPARVALHVIERPRAFGV